MTCILKYLNILTFPCLWWGATEGSPFSKAVLHSPVPDLTCLVKFTILPKDLAVQFCFINDSTALQSRPFISTALTIIKSSSWLYLCLVCFRLTPFVSTHYSSSGSKDLKDFLFPPSTPLSEKYYYFWTPLAQRSMHPQIVLEIEIIYNSIPIKAKFLQFSHLFARNCNTRSLLIKICLNSSVKFLHASV